MADKKLVQSNKKEEQLPRVDLAGGSLIVIAAIMVGAAVTYLGHILTPVFIAAFLYFLMKPLAEIMIRRRVPPWLAYFTLFIVVNMIGFQFIQIAYRNALQFRKQFPEIRVTVLDKINAGRELFGMETKTASLDELFEVSARDIFDYAFGTAFGMVELVLMVFFYLLFLILNADKISKRVSRAFDKKTAAHIQAMGVNISDSIKQYVKIKTAVSLGMGVSGGIVMCLFGLQYWMLWAILIFALNYITYVGSILACVPPIIVAFAQFDSILASVILTTLIGLNRFLWIDYVEIKYSGKHLNIDSVLLLMGLAYFGYFWGVLGLILAVPIMTCIKIFLENFENTKTVAILISEE